MKTIFNVVLPVLIRRWEIQPYFQDPRERWDTVLDNHKCEALIPNHRQNIYLNTIKTYEKNSVALVHKRTILAERPPQVGEVSANFYRQRVLRDQCNGSPRPLISIF
jgi:hypothetical protein